MPGLIGASEAASIRAALALFFVHAYTRTPVTAGSDSGYGPADVEGTPVTGQPCKFTPQARVLQIKPDRLLVNVPTLTVPSTDPIAPGDKVSNVADSDGTVMLAGPLTVYDVQASAGLGPTLKKTVILQGGDII